MVGLEGGPSVGTHNASMFFPVQPRSRRPLQGLEVVPAITAHRAAVPQSARARGQGDIIVKYRETSENPADMLTKPLDAATFKKHSDTLMANLDVSGTRSSTTSTIRQQTYDVEAAYLKGEFEGEVLYARPPPTGPPPGRRPYIRGIPVVWRLKAPLYGEADAGRIWNRTMVKQMTLAQHYKQSMYDPCYFYKMLSDGTRQDIVMYVDDGYCVDSGTAAADAELKVLHDKFTIDVKPAKFFLGNNITVAGA